jgi:hypothetical protein
MKKLAFLLLLVLLLAGCAPAPMENAVPAKVFFAGENGGVKTALDLAAQAGTVELVAAMAQADALVLDGVIPPGAAERAQAGAGVVLILGEGIANELASVLLGQPVTLTPAEDAVSLAAAKGVSDVLLTEIVWNGAPQVRERQALSGLDAGAQPPVSVFDSGEGVLHNIGGRTFVLTAAVSDKENPQLQEWGYFNYLIYHLAARAAGEMPLSFAAYPASPLPHAKERSALFAFLAAELVFFFILFIIVRRYSLRHPEALDSLIANKSRFLVQEAATSWERVGFHRPLSGLLVGMGLGILLFIPLIIYQNLILPQYILPSAQALTEERVKPVAG